MSAMVTNQSLPWSTNRRAAGPPAPGERDHALADVQAGQPGPHERRRDGDQQAPRAQRLDDEVRLEEQPPGEQEAERVDRLGAEHEPAREDRTRPRMATATVMTTASAAMPRNALGNPNRLRLPALGHLAAVDHGVEVAPEGRVRVRRERDRVDRQHERRQQPDRAGDDHLDRGPRPPRLRRRLQQVGVRIDLELVEVVDTSDVVDVVAQIFGRRPRRVTHGVSSRPRASDQRYCPPHPPTARPLCPDHVRARVGGPEWRASDEVGLRLSWSDAARHGEATN